MKIILQFSRSNSIGSWFIRLLTWSSWSHVDIILPDKHYLCDKEKKLIGALPMNGTYVHNSTYSRSKKYYVELDHLRDTKFFYNFLEKQIGKKYDWLGICAFIFRKRNWQNPKKWFCSELVAASFKHSGNIIVNSSASRVTPEDLIKSIRVKQYGQS